MRNKGFNAPYFMSSVDKQKELFNVVNNASLYFIVELDQGRIVAQGTHDQLLNSCNSFQGLVL